MSGNSANLTNQRSTNHETSKNTEKNQEYCKTDA